MTEKKTNKKSQNAFLWSFLDNILQQIVNFSVGIILARLLSPSDFGLIGIISVFIALSNTFVDSGLSDALINKKNAKNEDYHTIFWANLALGICTYIILFLLAPYLASFFERNELTLLIRITALSVIFMSLSSIQRTIFTKRINFKIITIVSIVAVFISGLVAVLMALNGYGVMSLVIRMVLGQFITLLVFYFISTWRPQFKFNYQSFKTMYAFGVHLFISRLFNAMYTNLYYFVIGKIFSPKILGFYTRAESFKNLASSNVINTVQRVSFSVLSSKSNEKSKMLLFKEILNGTFFITSLFMTVLFICTEEIILILVGEKWITSILYLKIITLSGFFLPLYSMNINFLAVMNKTKLHMKIDTYTKVLIVPVILIGIYYGIIEMLYGIVIVSVLNYIISSYILGKLFNFTFREQSYLIFKGGVLFLISIVLNEYFTFFNSENMYYSFLFKLFLIMAVFSIGVWILFPQLFKRILDFKVLNKN